MEKDENQPKLIEVANEWLLGFEAAVNGKDLKRLRTLFSADGSWRDLLAFTGDFRTTSGADEIAAKLMDSLGGRNPHFVTTKLSRISIDSRFHHELIEAFFEFEMMNGEGQGVVRLLHSSRRNVAWTLLTALEKLPDIAPSGESRVASDSLENDRSEPHKFQYFVGRPPTVLVVGAGQAGLAIAARLKATGTDCLVVERSARVGDNWRRRYETLRLHNQIWANHLPFLRFPEIWPVYIPKDKLANWFEFYADALDLNVWTDTEFIHGDFDSADLRWTVTVRTDGVERTLRPSHLVFATGVSGTPRVPHLVGLDRFEGTTLHSSSYSNGEQFRGKRVLVIGSGTSGHDTAHDLFLHGTEVTMMQRSATTILSLEPSAELAYALYRENRSTEECDLMALSIPYPMKCELQRKLTNRMSELDRELLTRLHNVGFRTDSGDDGTGFALKYLRRGGGYYINIGCSDLVASGQIALVQAENFSNFTANGILLLDGEILEFDAVVFATGYKSIQDEVRRMLGDATAEKLGSVWGLDEEGELRNICRPTAQPGLWFIAGGFPDARMWSPFLALQLQATERGLDLRRGALAATLSDIDLKPAQHLPVKPR